MNLQAVASPVEAVLPALLMQEAARQHSTFRPNAVRLPVWPGEPNERDFFRCVRTRAMRWHWPFSVGARGPGAVRSCLRR